MELLVSRENGGLSYQAIVSWLIPALLSAILGVLAWMGSSIHDMSTTLAVAVSKIDDHERRIELLEDHERIRRER
jgi:hypothetical protein